MDRRRVAALENKLEQLRRTASRICECRKCRWQIQEEIDALEDRIQRIVMVAETDYHPDWVEQNREAKRRRQEKRWQRR